MKLSFFQIFGDTWSIVCCASTVLMIHSGIQHKFGPGKGAIFDESGNSAPKFSDDRRYRLSQICRFLPSGTSLPFGFDPAMSNDHWLHKNGQDLGVLLANNGWLVALLFVPPSHLQKL